MRCAFSRPSLAQFRRTGWKRVQAAISSAKRCWMESSRPGHVAGFKGHENQTAACGSHSAGILTVFPVVMIPQ
jgi:hypothetical protein